MPSLRQRLQSESPELFAALLRSWEIAQAEWLPAIVPSEGSYNSFPHFTNIERHLDALLGAAGDTPATTLELSALELYLLLAAVLFHDFGRIYGDANHATASARAVPEHFAALGIPTQELAASLSRIALYHDPLTDRDKADDEAKHKKILRSKQALRDVRIEPYGVARELYVGTLLALADHMDGSVRRAVPHYVRMDDEVGFKGAFRRLVSGTGYDPATFTLKTTLSGFEEASDAHLGPFNYPELYPNFYRRNWRPDSKKSEQTPAIPAGEMERDPNCRCDLFAFMADRCCPDVHDLAPSKMFTKCLRGVRKAETDSLYTIERTIDETRHSREATVRKSLWPADYLLAVVLNDLHVNQGFLKAISGELEEMGLPIEGWFVEFGSQVFDATGKRDCEPLLRQGNLLERVAMEMWQLRCRLFDRGLMTYAVLADSLRMENVALVGLAVRRIAYVFNQGGDRIVAGTSGWKFRDARFQESDLLAAVRKHLLPA